MHWKYESDFPSLTHAVITRTRKIGTISIFRKSASTNECINWHSVCPRHNMITVVTFSTQIIINLQYIYLRKSSVKMYYDFNNNCENNSLPI